MAQLDALRLVASLRERLVDFMVDESYAKDPRLLEIAREIWSGPPEQGGLLSQVWVEGAFPSAEAPCCLDDLVEQGLFEPILRDHLEANGAVPARRPLYTHQEEALRSARGLGPEGEQPSLVIRAATGGGKTEAFLLPILDALCRQTEPLPPGIRCLILYPMNALVNDQVDRLYSWLKGQSRITLFHFTSETPESAKRADKEGLPRWEPCRFRTRQEARGLEDHDGRQAKGGPVPDILITNYSMLEYMLCRPQDAVLFGPALQALVLDEAHLYTGTLAAEIALLLRRLLIRCKRHSIDLLQIATSATLGTGDKEELRSFAATLFSKDARFIRLIQGSQQRVMAQGPSPCPPDRPTLADDLAGEPWLTGPTLVLNEGGQALLAQDATLCRRLRERLSVLVGRRSIEEADSEDRPAALLRSILPLSPLVRRLEEVLWRKRRLSLAELCQDLWGRGDEEALRGTVALLQLAASARCRPDDYPLIPHRLHVLARSSEGLGLCLSSSCPAPGDIRWGGLGGVSSGSQDHCPYCQASMLSLRRCANCGEVLLAGHERDGGLIPLSGRDMRGMLFSLDSPDRRCLTVEPLTGRFSGVGERGVRLYQVSHCPNCGAEASELKPFEGTTPLTLSIVAETLLASLPPYPLGQEWRPSGGRRLLAFSDSRSEAARLGPRLTRQHEIQLLRSAIVQCLEEQPLDDEGVLTSIEEDRERARARLERPGLSPGARLYHEKEISRLEQKLKDLKVGGSLDDWAYALSRQPLLAEVLDQETAPFHHGESWSQRQWEENRDKVMSRALGFLAQELARPARFFGSIEPMGLAEVTYPGLEEVYPPGAFLGTLPTEGARRRLRPAWSGFLQGLCDTLRMDGVITLGPDLDREYPYGSFLVGRWASEKQAFGSFLVRFIGETRRHRRQAFAEALLLACGLGEREAEALAPELLHRAFHQLLELKVPWLEGTARESRDGPPVRSLRLVFGGLGLRRPSELFICEKTGQVFPRSVLGCAPSQGVEGTLRAVSHEELDGDARLRRVRREYRSSPVFRGGLWAEEHSAQLSSRENRRIQDLFKAGVRNVLSATTTMELGIDIGGLNAVLMGNVPPGQANYLQRAGRAGRRSDGSSFVITFARPRPYDREVFHRLGDYLERSLRRPRVFMDRERVVVRHLHAYLLGRFFQAIYLPTIAVGAMNAFGRMGLFCGVQCPPRWERGDHKRPELNFSPLLSMTDPASLPWWDGEAGASRVDLQFRSFLLWTKREKTEARAVEELFCGTIQEAALSHWPELLDRVIEALRQAVDNWRDMYDQLLTAWQGAGSRAHGNALRYQMNALADVTVIEALADRQFLPRYSFPIRVHGLRVIVPDEEAGRVREEDQYRLERGSILALREYVPGSQLIVGGRIVTSRGILKHWTGADLDSAIGLRGRYSRCPKEHFYYSLSGSLGPCPLCQGPAAQSERELLFPIHGFSSAAWDPPRRSLAVDRVGIAETATLTFAEGERDLRREDFGNIPGLLARYREDGELLVYNTGKHRYGFAVCLRCGYTDSERSISPNAEDLPPGFRDHAALTNPKPWKRCQEKAALSVLRNQTLAAREVTDVLLLDLSRCLPGADAGLITTLGHALRQAAARLLELDSREIGMLVVPAGREGEGRGTLLYDTAAGGAGHVRYLLDTASEWLEMTRKVLYVDEAHHRRCFHACLDCLLSFESQADRNAGLLDRRRGLTALDSLLERKPVRGLPVVEEKRPGEAGRGAQSKEERLQRARARRERK